MFFDYAKMIEESVNTLLKDDAPIPEFRILFNRLCAHSTLDMDDFKRAMTCIITAYSLVFAEKVKDSAIEYLRYKLNEKTQ